MEIEESREKNEVQSEDLCGFGSWKPHWLQRFRSKKSFVLAHGITGMCYFAISSYFNATITTMEKQFKIPSRTSGLITGGWDVGNLICVLAIGYFGMHAHKPILISVGSLLAALSCFARLMPHLVYGPGKDALELTQEFQRNALQFVNFSEVSTSGPKLCGTFNSPEDCSNAQLSTVASLPAVMMFLAQFIQGIGCSIYWTLGFSYLDDNTTKNKAPLVHAATAFLRLLGPTVGFTLASYTLSKYVDPSLTPTIDNTDPRWIGGWWIGWTPLGIMAVILSSTTFLFPRQLPRTARRQAELLKRNLNKVSSSSKNFFATCRQLLKNKIIICNTLSSVFFFFGNTGYWIFMPKYMETIYQQSSSRSSLIAGSIGLASAGLGLTVSSIVISRFKPRPRLVAGWNVIVEILEMLCKFGWIFLDCGERNLQGDWGHNGTWNLTESCNAECDCGSDVKYSPVCSMEGNSLFYSPCHAGCNSSMVLNNGTKIFNNCSCIPSGTAIDGPCVMDCVTNFTIFLVSQSIMSFLGASGRAGNILVQIRCVPEDHKPMSIAFSEFLLSALVFIPAPIVFGMLLDTTCLVWGTTCGKSGNCWLYNDQELRFLLNISASGLIAVGVLFDTAVCYLVKDLQIYDEDISDDKKEGVLSNRSVLDSVF